MSPADPNTDARADAAADVGALMAQGESKERGSNNEVQVPVVGMTDALDPEALAKLLGPPVARESDAPAPFLDVFNICTLKERNGKGYDVSDFSKLLVEPVAVPSLHHTGVHTSMAELAPDAANDLQTRGSGAQGPFFYANGRKKKTFRAEIRKAFRKAELGPAANNHLDPLSHGPRTEGDDARRVQTLCDKHLHRERNAIYCEIPKRRPRANLDSVAQISTSPSQLDVVAYKEAKHKPRMDGSSVVPLAAPRETDRTVRRLLSSIRRETQRMEALSLSM